MAITRRNVLVAMAAVTVGAALVGEAGVLRWWNHAPGEGLIALDKEEYEMAQALAEAWMPPGAGPPDISGSEANCGKFLDEVVSRMDDFSRKGLKALLQIFDDMPLLTEHKRFTQLDRYDRARVLKSWMDSPLYLERQAIGAIMILIGFGYEVHPQVSKVFSPWYGCGFGA